MCDKGLSLAQPMREKKACREKDSCPRVADVKSTIIILSSTS